MTRQISEVLVRTFLFVGLLVMGSAHVVLGQNEDITWTGNGDGSTFSDNNNWSTQFGALGPEFAFANDSLKFSTTGATTVNNDLDPAANGDVALQLGPGLGTEATSAAFHFLNGSGNFTLTGFAVSAGSTGSDGVFRADAGAGTLQTLNMPITFTGGQKRRMVALNNNGTVVFNGDINYTNSIMFLNEGAGRVELNGNNTGVGPNVYKSGTPTFALTTNSARTTLRNNVSGTVLSLGSDTALGDAGTGTWDAGDLQLRGLSGNEILTVETDAARDLSGYNFALANGSGGGAIRFNSASDVSIGSITRNGNGTRTASVTNSGVLTIENGIFVSESDQARDLAIFAGGAGGNVDGSNGQVVVNGRLHTTLVDPLSAAGTDKDGNEVNGGIDNSSRGGIDAAKQINAVENNEGNDPPGTITTKVNGILQTRFGTVTLNGDSSSTWIGGQVTINRGSKVIMGHANALGDSTSLIAIQNNSTIDLNGHTLIQRFNQSANGLGGTGFNGEGSIINSNTSTPGKVASDIVSVGNFSVGGAGDLELGNYFHNANVQRNITKVGSGTVALGGDATNSRYGLIVNEGTVRLSKETAGGFATNAVINNPLLINNGSTVVIGNSVQDSASAGFNNQIHNGTQVDITAGTFDLAGNREAIGRLSGGSTSVVESNAAPLHGNADARIAIGEHSGAAAAGVSIWAGTIKDGTHALGVSVNGGLKQVFTGANTYTGETLVLSSVVSTQPGPPGTNLVVNGSVTGTSKVSVDNGAILSGVGSITSRNWDIHGTVKPGGDVPSATESLTIDYSAANSSSSESLLFQSDSTVAFTLGAGVTNSKINLIGSANSLVVLDGNTFDFTDATSGSLTAGIYTLFDGDASTSYNLGSVALTGLGAYSGSSVSVSGNDLVLNLMSGGGLACDLDGDGDCDPLDIDKLYDSSPTATAISSWLAEASKPGNPYNPVSGSSTDTYVLGDINLDGNVNSSDLGALLNNFNSTAGVKWSGGDLNADAIVNSSDLGSLLNNFNFTSSLAAAAVPEPGSSHLFVVALFGFLGICRRSRTK